MDAPTVGILGLLTLGACGPAAPEPEVELPGTDVFVLTTDIAPGALLTEDSVQVERFPDAVASGGTTDATLIGQTAVAWMFEGEPVRKERLAPLGSQHGLDALVPAERRATIRDIPVPALQGVAIGNAIGLTVDPRPFTVLAVDPAGQLVVTVPEGATAPRTLGVPTLLNIVDAGGEASHGPTVTVEGKPAAAVKGQPSWVAVATRRLEPGLPIGEADVVFVEAEGYALVAEHVLGTIPRAWILPGEAVRTQRLADPAEGIGLAAVIPRGLVGLGVPAPEGSTVKPGQTVDLRFDGKRLQGVFVLSTGPGALQLLLSPTQAAAVAAWPGTWSGGLALSAPKTAE